MKKLEPSYTTGGNVKWCSTLENRLLFKEFNIDPAISLMGTYPKEMKTYMHIESCVQMFIVALYITAN